METPMGSGRGQGVSPAGQQPDCKERLTPQRETNVQEANATSRKTTGINNRVDRAGKPEIPTSKESRRGSGEPPAERGDDCK